MPNAVYSAHGKSILLSSTKESYLFNFLPFTLAVRLAGEIIIGNTKQNLFQIEKLLFIV